MHENKTVYIVSKQTQEFQYLFLIHLHYMSPQLKTVRPLPRPNRLLKVKTKVHSFVYNLFLFIHLPPFPFRYKAHETQEYCC